MADAHTKQHDYHLLDPSPWPLVASIAAFFLAVGTVVWLKGESGVDFGAFTLTGSYLMYASLIAVVITSCFWWADMIRESVHDQAYTPVVRLHFRYAMLLFISSEVMFFVAFFWAYFDAALFPDYVQAIAGSDIKTGLVARNEATGGIFPPKGTHTFNPWDLPLINTLILLLSGTTVTWAHHALLNNDRKGLISGLVITVCLGVLFTILQAVEYAEAPFTLDSTYGTYFFLATGFHGFHVIIGTIFLCVILFRALNGHFTQKNHFGFEAAAWYWHFVDVVWLFLFASIYIWGAGVPIAH